MDIQNPTTLQHNTKYDQIYSKKVHSIDYNAYKPANQGLVQSKPVPQGKTPHILITSYWNEIAIKDYKIVLIWHLFWIDEENLNDRVEEELEVLVGGAVKFTPLSSEVLSKALNVYFRKNENQPTP